MPDSLNIRRSAVEVLTVYCFRGIVNMVVFGKPYSELPFAVGLSLTYPFDHSRYLVKVDNDWLVTKPDDHHAGISIRNDCPFRS